MRTLPIYLLAAALLVLSADSAGAFAINMNVRGGLQPSYTLGDTVTVDVFLDAPTGGITFLVVNVISDVPGLSYSAAASEAKPVIHPAPSAVYGTTGSLPGYLLYSPAAHPAPAIIMYPQQTPAWLNWPGPPPPGKEVVNINFEEEFFPLGITFKTGNNIWIGTLVYHVSGSGVIELAINPALGGTFSSWDGEVATELGVDLGPSIVINGPEISVPEPLPALGPGAAAVLAATLLVGGALAKTYGRFAKS